MKAFAVYPGEKQFRIIDAPEPRMTQPSHVLLRVLEVGICGTDKEIAHFEYGTPPPGSDHLILGHESLAEVVEVGPGVKRLKTGQLVVPTVRRPCPDPGCRACRAGRQDFCSTGNFTERGIKGQHGFMAGLVVEDERYLAPVPAELREVGVLVEPLTIAEKGISQLWQVQERLPWAHDDYCGTLPGTGHDALVLGAGPVGILGALKLVQQGFRTFVYSMLHGQEKKKQMIESVGVTFIEAEKVPVSALRDHAPMIDVVYEAVGASSLAFDVLQHLDTNGVFIFTGVPGRRGHIQIDGDLLMRDLVLRNQVVFGTVNAPMESFQAAVGDLREFSMRWPGRLQAMITNRIPLERVEEALMGKLPGIKNVVTVRG
jgi:threonine dehydrogenase-like Zn-dependent dehydrogenase